MVSKRTFDRVGHYLRRMLWRWARWNHPDKSRGWIKRRYHSADAHGAFSVWIHNRDGKRRALSVNSVARTVIERHIKVRGEANPYQPEHVEYFEKRRCFVWRTSPVGKLRALKAGRDKIATQDAVITKNSDWRITSAEVDLRKA